MPPLLWMIISIVSSGDILKEYKIDTDATIIKEVEVSNTKPTLKGYLSDLPHIYERLEKIHMNDIDTFIHINDRALDALCEEYKITTTIFDKIKLKAVIKAMRADLAPITSQKSRETLNEAQKTGNVIESALKESIHTQSNRVDILNKQSPYKKIQNDETDKTEQTEASKHSLSRLILLAVIGALTIFILWCWWRKSKRISLPLTISPIAPSINLQHIKHINIPQKYDFYREHRGSISSLRKRSKIRQNKIALEYHSHRKHYGFSFHPKNLLMVNDSRYYSANNNDFSENENDWIIFKIKQDGGLHFPKSIKIQNGCSKRGVKTMRVSIGDGQNKWISLDPNTIDVSSSLDLQEFAIYGVKDKLIKGGRFIYVKLEFITNHGNREKQQSRFAVQQFGLFGISCS